MSLLFAVTNKSNLIQQLLNSITIFSRCTLAVISLLYLLFQIIYVIKCLKAIRHGSLNSQNSELHQSIVHLFKIGLFVIALVAVNYFGSFILGIPVQELLGFDPVHDFVSTFSFALSSSSLTNILMMLLIYLLLLK